MKIDYLVDHPEFIAELADLHYAEWHYLNPDETLEQKLDYLKSNSGRQGVPSFVIAVEGNELIGSASLIAHDMDDRADLTPWLADVYVKPVFRRQGVATALIQHIEAEARSAGISELFLYTPDAAELYQRLGWAMFEACRYHGVDVTIMTKRIR
jgi:N-acetylglutamate synthase-like GNAT family acetyltransferase